MSVSSYGTLTLILRAKCMLCGKNRYAACGPIVAFAIPLSRAVASSVEERAAIVMVVWVGTAPAGMSSAAPANDSFAALLGETANLDDLPGAVAVGAGVAVAVGAGAQASRPLAAGTGYTMATTASTARSRARRCMAFRPGRNAFIAARANGRNVGSGVQRAMSEPLLGGPVTGRIAGSEPARTATHRRARWRCGRSGRPAAGVRRRRDRVGRAPPH